MWQALHIVHISHLQVHMMMFVCRKCDLKISHRLWEDDGWRDEMDGGWGWCGACSTIINATSVILMRCDQTTPLQYSLHMGRPVARIEREEVTRAVDGLVVP